MLWTSALQALVDMGATLDIVYPGFYKPLFLNDPRFRHQFSAEEFSPSKEKYDFVLNFHASDSSARLAKRVSAQEHIFHFHDRTPKGNSSHKIPFLGQPMKATERDLNVVRAVGWNGEVPPTKIFPPPSSDLKHSHGKPLVLFGISASRPAKEWPMEHFITLSRLLAPIAQVSIVYEKEADFRSPYWKGQLQKHATLIHTPTLAELMQTLVDAKLYIGSDSGVKHLSVALGVKTLTLFGPESIGEWHCYGEEQLALQIPVSCRQNHPIPKEFAWCGVHQCPLASHACMRLITPETVYKTVFTSLVD